MYAIETFGLDREPEITYCTNQREARATARRKARRVGHGVGVWCGPSAWPQDGERDLGDVVGGWDTSRDGGGGEFGAVVYRCSREVAP